VAKSLKDILKKPLDFPFVYINPDIQQCHCGQYLIKGEHECMESGVIEGRFCDIVCLVRADGAKWIGCTIVDEFGNTYSEKKYLEVMEVIAC
jgi:hypothetical protein